MFAIAFLVAEIIQIPLCTLTLNHFLLCIITYQLIDLRGNVVRSTKVETMHHKYKLNVSEVESGTYLVRGLVEGSQVLNPTRITIE